MTDLRSALVAVEKKDYGDRYEDHCLEIYRIYVGMADNISNRRQSANSFFLSVNTAILAVFGLSTGPFREWLWALSIAGIILCFSWYRLIRSYKDLNTAKFKVIHEIERVLPFAPFDAEWEAVGRGNSKELYLPFTHIEIRVPWVFMLIHALSFLMIISPLIVRFVKSNCI